MIDSAARAERFDPAPSISPCYTWEVPQKPVLVRLPLLLIDRLEREAVETFRSVSSRGSEIGGVLWGSVEPGEPAALSIVEYELVPCDYTLGPLYRLAETDLARLDKVLAQRGGLGVRPVGFFRSHTRKALSLDADDVALMDSRFREPHQVALVIRPYATKASTAGIFIRENGQIHAEASYQEFPFRSAQLAPSKHLADVVEPGANTPAPPAAPKPAVRAQIVPIASRRDIAAVPPLAAEVLPTPVPQPVPQPVVQPVPQPAAQAAPPAPQAAPQPAAQAAVSAAPQPVSQPAPASETREIKPIKPILDSPLSADAALEPEAESHTEDTIVVVPVAPTRAKTSSKLIWFAVGTIFPLLLSGVLFIYPGVFRHAPPGGSIGQDSSPLALRVERSGGELLLTWNNDSGAIRNATRAVLSISDGEQHENVEMDLAQLRNGRIEYLPVTGDVVFRMEVSGKNNTKTASESVRVLRTRPSPMPPDDQPQPASGAAGKLGQNSVPGGGAPPNGEIPTSPAANGAVPNAPPVEIAPGNVTPATAPPLPVKPFNTASLSERLRPVRPDEIALPDAPAVGGASVTTPDSALGLTAVAAPALPAMRKSDAPPKQSVASAGGDVQQAQLIYRKNPDYPAIARSAGAKGTVELVATIGTNGRVRAVKVTKGHPLLQKAAVDAVMQWQYRPTMLNGRPVETETNITLNFVNDR